MHHLRLGSISGLLVIDALGLVVLGYDIYRFKRLKLSFNFALEQSERFVQSYPTRYSLVLIILLTIIAPIIIAFIRVHTAPHPRLSRLLGARNTFVILLHLVCAIVIGVTPILLTSMQFVSGFEGVPAGEDYSFSSYLLIIESVFFTYGIGYFATGISVLFTIYLGILLQGSRTPQYLRSYALKLALADLGSELYPSTGRHILNFNMPAIAPEIHFVRKYAQEIFKEYQQKIPGSRASGKFIGGVADQCKEMLKQFLLLDNQHTEFGVELFPTTSRAMEVALTRIPEPKELILSPFEHPTEMEVATWTSAATRSKVHRVQFRADEYSEKRERQVRAVIDQVKAILSSAGKTYVLVISEVCYATGMITPIREVIETLRSECTGFKLKVIVDGAHAAGNFNGHSLGGFRYSDAYVLSAHKWLMSPEPCGILFSRYEGDRLPRSYDSWGDELPINTASVHMVAGLAGSLELLKNVGVENLWERSRGLREYFLKRVQKKFKVIGEDSGLPESLMLAIRPGAGYCWKYNPELLSEYMDNKSAFALVLKIDPTSPWIRIAFAYFLETQEVDKLCRVLDGAIKPC
jgi:selenocysteine lyase/cysteine desulfurase